MNFWALALCLCVCSVSSALEYTEYNKAEIADYHSRVFKKDLERGLLAKRTNTALGHLIWVAAYKLKQAGHVNEGLRIQREWDQKYKNALTQRNLGDHAPLSKFLSDLYILLQLVLDQETISFFGLTDINVFNFAIPIIFRCIDNVDAVEYEKHFTPFTGAVGYWGTWGACMAATCGSGWLLICNPSGMLVRQSVLISIGPMLSDGVWEIACKKEGYYVGLDF